MIKRAILSAIGTILITFLICASTARADTSKYEPPDDIRRHCEVIGEELGICPEVLMALAFTESSYKPEASNGSCIGLMGINKHQAQSIADAEGLVDIWDPYNNIYIGALMLLDKADMASDIGAALSYYKGYRASTVEKYINKGELPPLTKKCLDIAYELEEAHGKH